MQTKKSLKRQTLPVIPDEFNKQSSIKSSALLLLFGVVIGSCAGQIIKAHALQQAHERLTEKDRSELTALIGDLKEVK